MSLGRLGGQAAHPAEFCAGLWIGPIKDTQASSAEQSDMQVPVLDIVLTRLKTLSHHCARQFWIAFAEPFDYIDRGRGGHHVPLGPVSPVRYPAKKTATGVVTFPQGLVVKADPPMLAGLVREQRRDNEAQRRFG